VYETIRLGGYHLLKEPRNLCLFKQIQMSKVKWKPYLKMLNSGEQVMQTMSPCKFDVHVTILTKERVI